MEWRVIREYPNYSVSNTGKVKSNKTDKILKEGLGSHGYYTVTLYKDGIGKSHTIHRLVAKSFLDDYSEYLEVNHKDESKTNNSVQNLEMCNRVYNRTYGTATERHKRKISMPIIQENLNGEFINRFSSIMDAARELNLNPTSIAYCCKGGYFDKSRNSLHKVNSVGNYKFKYDRRLGI